MEVFGGSGAVLFTKPRSHFEVWNDLDGGVVNFMRVLRDRGDELREKLTLTPHSREEYLRARVSWHAEEDELEKARLWFVTIAQSYSAKPPGVAFTGWNGEFRGISHVPAPRAWRSNVDALSSAAERLRGVQVECLDWREVFNRYDHADSCFYVDPPYVHETRKQVATRAYNHEMTNDEHAELVERLLGMQAHAVVSGYDSQLYAPLERAGWEVFRRHAITRFGSGARGKAAERMEIVWRRGDENLLTLLAREP